MRIDINKFNYLLDKYEETKKEQYIVSIYNDFKVIVRNVLFSKHYEKERLKLKAYEADDIIDYATNDFICRILKKPSYRYKRANYTTCAYYLLKYYLYNDNQKQWNRQRSIDKYNENKEM